jgi:hypothetical protein
MKEFIEYPYECAEVRNAEIRVDDEGLMIIGGVIYLHKNYQPEGRENTVFKKCNFALEGEFANAWWQGLVRPQSPQRFEKERPTMNKEDLIKRLENHRNHCAKVGKAYFLWGRSLEKSQTILVYVIAVFISLLISLASSESLIWDFLITFLTAFIVGEATYRIIFNQKFFPNLFSIKKNEWDFFELQAQCLSYLMLLEFLGKINVEPTKELIEGINQIEDDIYKMDRDCANIPAKYFEKGE